MSKVKIHEFYTPSAAIHAICQEYEINKVEMGKRLGVTNQLLSIVVNCKQPMSENLLEEIEHKFPIFRGRIVL